MTSTRKFLYFFTPFTLLCAAILVLNANRGVESNISQGTSDSLAELVSIDSSAGKVVEPLNENKYTRGLTLKWYDQYDSGYFQFPLDSNYGLSGTFGELRSNHFHAGLDLRTGGIEGLPLYASADGYVARIKVSLRGYGKALYLIHPNGYQTVYGHLSKFNPIISDYVEKKQYRSKSYEVEDYPRTNLIKVKKGEIIAYSGNTGGSGGPHLHFEIRDGRTGQSINPILFDVGNNDIMPPEIKDIAVYDINLNQYHRTGNYATRYFKRNRINGRIIHLPPGEYGLGCHWNDYFTDRYNKLGVNRAYLAVNGKIRFTQFIKSITFSQGRYINKHIDFASSKTQGKKFVRMFHEKSNPLKYYEHLNKGMIELSDKDTLRILLKALDYGSAPDSIWFTLIGDENQRPWATLKNEQVKSKFAPNKTNSYSSAKCKIGFPKGALYDSVYFNYEMKMKKGRTFHFIGNESIPLHKYCNLKLKLDSDQIDSKGLCIASLGDGDEIIYEGGNREGNWISTRTRSFGTYFITSDTLPPKMKFLSNKNRQLRVKLSDDFSGIKSYKVAINDKWVLMEYEPKTNRLFGEIPSWIKSGSADLIIVATDKRNNSTKLKKNIIIQ
jgi:murein DD-endopeptidase MepM/ murein hydrolase activator NlpD